MRAIPSLSLTSVPLAAALLAGAPMPALGSEFVCERGGAIRRVEIAVQDEVSRVPCEVVYWRDTEQPGVRDVLWNARTDAAFCVRQAEDLVRRLEGGGWRCAAGDPQAAALAPQQPTEPPQAAAPTQPVEPAQPAAPAQPDAPASPAEVPLPAARPDAPPAQAGLTEETGDNGADLIFPQPSDRANLEAVIEQNLRRLNESAAGEFAAEIAAYGDLDGDGVADAVIFFTYEAGTPEAMQFVAVYLFDGRNYKLVATRSIGQETDPAVADLTIERIEDGAILLRQGTRRTALQLRAGELVEVF